MNHSGIGNAASLISAEIGVLCGGLSAHIRESLGMFAACMLVGRTSNLMVLGEHLPRDIGDNQHRYQYLSRLLKRDDLHVDTVMASLCKPLFMAATTNDRTAVIMMDQTHIRDGYECLSISLHVQGRAIPVLWDVVETRGAIGWDIAECLLNRLMDIVPIGTKLCLMADRFYGHAKLIGWCQRWGMGYRIRLKSNLNLAHQGGAITTGEAARQGITSLQDARLGTVTTHIGIVQESGCNEPWIIAMDVPPTKARTLDYSLRWGCEAMFSDHKSQGFNLEQTKLVHTERIEKLMLVMAIAMIAATGVGISMKNNAKTLSKKHSEA